MTTVPNMQGPLTPPRRHLQKLTEQLQLLRGEVLTLERSRATDIERAAPECRASARNLIHYLAVRQHDLRGLQRDLARLGLSSLGRMEARVLPTLNAVLLALHRLSGQAVPSELVGSPAADLDMDLGDALLREHTLQLLGPAPERRTVRIMVTMPSEAADDPRIALHALERGMNVMRINCAHDAEAAWSRMVAHLQAASLQLERECRVEFDLAGPKLRTGAVAPGPEVLKWKPERDLLGRVTTPAHLWLSADSGDLPEGAQHLPLQKMPELSAQIGDRLRLTDARGRRRHLKLTALGPDGWLCTCERTGYVTSGQVLRLYRGNTVLGKLTLGRLPAKAQALLLKVGDTLVLTSSPEPGERATTPGHGGEAQPAHISCTLPQVFGAARSGHRILFDDGKITGLIQKVSPEALEIRITEAPGGSAKLRAEKGINLPDTALGLPVLNSRDLSHLKFLAPHGDLVSLSFVRRREDIELLIRELASIGAANVGIVLKIENRQAFENLPELLLAALQHAPVAVMVARGDLAVEIGFERLAEVQEEVLWLCEAAHVPVIWATQVLDTLAQTGAPTRAEVTDAAMAGRAECVMLNKGPYIDEAIEFLGNVLERMQQHQDKKTARLRQLRVSGRS